jgi:hypothetical protein
VGVTVGRGRRPVAEDIRHLGFDVSLEDFMRRFIRGALHDKLRAIGVPDAHLSEISVSSCSHDNPVTRRFVR